MTRGSDVLEHSPLPKQGYVMFLLLNPPAVLVDLVVRPVAPLTDAATQLTYFAVSIAWWLALAIRYRRRHARPLETAVV